MRQIAIWWRKKRHEREFLAQLRRKALDSISPAHVEAEVTTLLKGMFDRDAVIQHTCLELLRRTNSAAVARALRPYLEGGWLGRRLYHSARAIRFYRKVIELLSGEQNKDTVEILIMLALVEQDSIREEALRLLKQVSAPYLVDHGVLVLLLREYELAGLPGQFTSYYLGIVLAGLIVFVYLLAPVILLSPGALVASFAFMCIGGGLFTLLQVSALLHLLRDQRGILLQIMEDFLQKQGTSAALREYATQRVDHLRRKIGVEAGQGPSNYQQPV